MPSTRTGATRRQEDARRLRDAIRALVRRFSISERADVSCCGMTIAQAATLEVLRAEGTMRLGDLGRRLGISPSTLTRNLARLEDRGLVERTSDPDDARAARAGLTAAGRRAADDVARQEIEFAGEILDRIPRPSRVAVRAHLETLLLAVREATHGCCGDAFDHLMQGIANDGAACAADARGSRRETGS